MTNCKTKFVFLLLTVAVGTMSVTTVASQASAQNLTNAGINMTNAENMTDTTNATGSVSKMTRDYSER